MNMLHTQPEQPDRPGLEREPAAEAGMLGHLRRR